MATPIIAAKRAGTNRARLALRVFVIVVIFVLLTVTPDGMLRFIHAWQVSWLAGRGLGPPSLPGWASGLWAVAHRLQSRGRLRLRVSYVTALTEFPFRFHTKRRFSEHQALLNTHFVSPNARRICDAIQNRNASFLVSTAFVAHKHCHTDHHVSSESPMDQKTHANQSDHTRDPLLTAGVGLV